MIEREQMIDELFAEAVNLSPGERENFFAERKTGDGSLLDDSVLNEVKALLRNFQSAEDNGFLYRPLVATESLDGRSWTLIDGQDFEGYKILKLIAEGGMGEVYLAHDPELDRKVAIKLIKSNLKTKELLRRFRNERQILANLQHPNIARLFEAGANADGLPFFVMEYVEGKPIDQYASENQLSLTDRLKLFRTVCSAITCAHQNLVIHRDIKPSNILVTANGEPKLLDFGIAKLLHETDSQEATLTLFQAMTPEYASPEQVKGEAITTASDVYSLGVLLYELLTGRGPYNLKKRTTGEITKAICEQEPAKPSSAAIGRLRPELSAAVPPDVRKVSDLPSVPPKSSSGLRPDRGHSPKEKESEASRWGTAATAHQAAEPQKKSPTEVGTLNAVNPKLLRGDLDNIVLKALRKEPQRRYASVEQFSEDIRRHLEGLPVSARKDTFTYRTSKFIQRNKLGAAAAAFILLTLVAGIIATAWEAHKARVQSAKAEQRFNEVRELAHSVLFDYHDAIASLPGSTPARERLVKDALKYLDELSDDLGNSPSLQRELATAYLRVGDVQGRPYASNLGQTDGALASYQKALLILEPMSSSNQQDNELKRDLATVYERIGNIQLRKGNGKDALDKNNKAMDMRQALLATDPSNKNYRREVADSYLYIGDALQAKCLDLECMRTALEDPRRALEIRQALAKEDPSDLEIRRDIAQAYGRISFRLSNFGQSTGDKKYFQQWLESDQAALMIRRELATANPTNARDRRNLADQLMATARAQGANADTAGALIGLRESLDIFKALSSADPTNSEARRDLSFVYYSLAAAYDQAGETRAARENYAEVLRVDQELLDKDATNVEDWLNVHNTFYKLSGLSKRIGDWAGAIENLQRVVEVSEKIVTLGPDTPSHLDGLANAYRSMGNLFAESAGAHLANGILNEPIPPATTAERVQSWREAKNWFQKSFDAYREMQRKGLPTLDTSVIAREISQCDAALAKSH